MICSRFTVPAASALVMICTQVSLMAEQKRDDMGQLAEAALPPKLKWIITEKFRGGYNYNARLEWFSTAQKCGMNAIISRLEIANAPQGDTGLAKLLKPGQRRPDALISFDLLEPSSRLAKRLGLHWFYMLNLAGSWGNYTDGIRGNPRRYNNGRLFAPTDDVYWTRVVENRFLRVAKLLEGREYQIDGFLIDPEMYALGGATPPGLDFGDYALSEFCKENRTSFDFRQCTIPQRKDWFAENSLEEKLAQFQFARIRSLARRTREKVQAIHPDALFGFFLWRDSFWFPAVAAGFSTPRTPCFVGPESTYPGGYSKSLLVYENRIRQTARVPIFFIPGLALTPADNQERLNAIRGNLFHRSIRSQGYWFWSLSGAFGGPERLPRSSAFLQTVNTELDKYAASGGNYVSKLRPAPLPADIPAHLQDTLLRTRAWEPLPGKALPASPVSPLPMGLRGLHTFVFQTEKNTEVSFEIANVRLGQYLAPTALDCYRPDSSRISFPDIPLKGKREVKIKPALPGAWILAVTSHNNAYQIQPKSTRVVLYSPDKISGCGHPGDHHRYYFYVPKRARIFQLEFGGSGGEPATFRLFGPDGNCLVEKPLLRRKIAQRIDARHVAGRVCWLDVTEITEDYSFELKGIPNIFAARPGQLLAPEE